MDPVLPRESILSLMVFPMNGSMNGLRFWLTSYDPQDTGPSPLHLGVGWGASLPHQSLGSCRSLATKGRRRILQVLFSKGKLMFGDFEPLLKDMVYDRIIIIITTTITTTTIIIIIIIIIVGESILQTRIVALI